MFCLAISRQRALDAHTSMLEANQRDIMSIKQNNDPNRSECTGKLCEGNGGENERRGGERGEIARKVRNPTEQMRRLRKNGSVWGPHDLMN